nr:class I SAM-dependent methyltransferase [Pseudoalteromonas sp. SA25]
MIYHFPLYAGQVNIARLLTFYEIYKQVVNISGEVADIGTWKGASLLTLAKLSSLLEPHSNTELYAYDWFQGTHTESNYNESGKTVYQSSRVELEKLISGQGLQDRININELDLSKDTKGYFEGKSWLRFKLIFMDCGIQAVLKHSLPEFWDKLSNGGILVLDHYNHPSSPYESDVVQSLIGDRVVHQIPFSRSPTGYIIK